MQIHSGDTIVFSGTAYLDSGLQNPANLSNYNGFIFSIVSQVTQATYVATVGTSSTFYIVNAPAGVFSITFPSGSLTATGSYYCLLSGTVGSTITTFYLGSTNARPYLEIDS
jgi:hypothetical protein